MAALSTTLLVTLTTMKMVIPGMPEMPPGIDMGGMGAPQKTLTMNLTSDQKAGKDAFAKCKVPGGLKLGEFIDLSILRPEKIKDTPETTNNQPDNTKPDKMIIKMYWGCGKSVASGQPRILDTSDTTSIMKEYNAKMPKGANKSMYSFGNDTSKGSFAFYPGLKANKPLVKQSSAPGNYNLLTNYTGETTFSLADDQDFLPAMEMVSPSDDIDLAKFIRIEWKPVSGAVGYRIQGFGSKSKSEMITWNSSSSPDMAMGSAIDRGAITSEQMDKYIKNGLIIAPDVTVCNVPAGIFEGTEGTMLTITVFGRDKIQEKDSIRTEITIRSTIMLPLAMGNGEKPEKQNKTTNNNKENKQNKDINIKIPNIPGVPNLPNLPSLPF